VQALTPAGPHEEEEDFAHVMSVERSVSAAPGADCGSAPPGISITRTKSPSFRSERHALPPKVAVHWQDVDADGDGGGHKALQLAAAAVAQSFRGVVEAGTTTGPHSRRASQGIPRRIHRPCMSLAIPEHGYVRVGRVSAPLPNDVGVTDAARVV
jgi:hypothetical protein